VIKCFQNIRSQAKALQHEAARVLEEAKREVEKMILEE
jgi:F0F1-type ATP synthase membrane subunit b/b'